MDYKKTVLEKLKLTQRIIYALSLSLSLCLADSSLSFCSEKPCSRFSGTGLFSSFSRVLRLNDINGTETPCARLEAAFQLSGAPDAVLYFPYVHQALMPDCPVSGLFVFAAQYVAGEKFFMGGFI